MGQDLDKLSPRKAPVPKVGSLVPAKARRLLSGMMVGTSLPRQAERLSNASFIYGIAAAVLIAIGFTYMMRGHWWGGFLLLLPAGCFLGFSVYFLRPGR